MAMTWHIGTGDGGVAVRLPRDFGAEIDAHTGDGHISVDFPVTASFQERRQNEVRGKINGGGSTFRSAPTTAPSTSNLFNVARARVFRIQGARATSRQLLVLKVVDLALQFFRQQAAATEAVSGPQEQQG